MRFVLGSTPSYCLIGLDMVAPPGASSYIFTLIGGPSVL
jgi:hypothetical protein